MLADIIMNTPLWVFIVLALCLILGWWQSRAQAGSIWRFALPALAVVALSLWLATYHSGWLAHSVMAWIIGFTVAIIYHWYRQQQQTGVFYVARNKRFIVPKNWQPLVWMVGLFVIAYMTYMAKAMQLSVYLMDFLNLTLGLLAGWFIGRFLVTTQSHKTRIIAPNGIYQRRSNPFAV